MRHSRLHLVQLSMANGKIAWRRCRHDEATRWRFGHVVDRLRGASQSAVTAAMTSAREGGTPVSLVACRWSFIGLPEHRLTVPPARCAASLLPGNHALSKRSGCHWTSPALYLLRVRGFVHACVIRRRGIHPRWDVGHRARCDPFCRCDAQGCVHVSANGTRRTGSRQWVHTCRQDQRAGRNGSSGDPFAAAATGAVASRSGMLIA